MSFLDKGLLDQHLIEEKRCDTCENGKPNGNSSWVICSLSGQRYVWKHSCEEWKAEEAEKKKYRDKKEGS